MRCELVKTGPAMPELKFLRQPTRTVTALDQHGRPVDLAALEGRRVKWARRQGNKVMAMIERPKKGARGALVVFPNAADYENSIRRVLKPKEPC
jgi:hypothetical protein